MRKVFVGMLVLSVLVLSSCAKKKNKKLAHNYYKLAMLELAEDQRVDVSAKKALEQVDKALDVIQDPRYLALKATLLFQLNYMQESKEFFEKALCASSCDSRLKAEIMNNYACALAESNEPEKALSVWRQLEMDKDYLTPEVCMVNQAKVFAKKGEMQISKGLLQRAIKIAPQYVDAHYYLALLALKTHDLSLAQEELNSLTFLEPSHPGIGSLSQACHAGRDVCGS